MWFFFWFMPKLEKRIEIKLNYVKRKLLYVKIFSLPFIEDYLWPNLAMNMVNDFNAILVVNCSTQSKLNEYEHVASIFVGYK